MPDIDIDFFNRDDALSKIKYVAASRLDDRKKLVKHNTGVYLQEVPFDPINNLCAVPYDSAEEQGLFKIDFLNVGLYRGVKNEEHLSNLLNQEPLWDLLQQDEFINLLFHINGHGDIVRKMKPDSIPKLAAVLAIIRPAKKHLIGKSWDEVFNSVWDKPDNDSYYFKKSHATAYAAAIVVQMNLICEQVSYGYQ